MLEQKQINLHKSVAIAKVFKFTKETNPFLWPNGVSRL